MEGEGGTYGRGAVFGVGAGVDEAVHVDVQVVPLQPIRVRLRQVEGNLG